MLIDDSKVLESFGLAATLMIGVIIGAMIPDDETEMCKKVQEEMANDEVDVANLYREFAQCVDPVIAERGQEAEIVLNTSKGIITMKHVNSNDTLIIIPQPQPQ